MSKQKEITGYSGFGVIEVIVSILILGLLGVILAGGLTQIIVANSKNILETSASQFLTEEANRIQGIVASCAELNSRLAGTTSTTQLILGEETVIQVSSEKVGWTNCGEIASGAYPVRLTASSNGSTLFTADTLVVVK